MGEVFQRPDAAFAEILTQQHSALSVHQDGIDANVEKLQALNELMDMCANAREDAGVDGAGAGSKKDKAISIEDPKRMLELVEKVKGLNSQEFIQKLSDWVEAQEEAGADNHPEKLTYLKDELKKFERELSTYNRKVEMDIQTIMNRFSYYKDMLYQNHTIAQSTAKAMERLHEAFLRVGRY